jgi:phosphoglycolate phosphatase-like HAD superfamily hydrolase
LFKEIIGGDKSTSLKPDPAQVLELLHKYQVNKNRALFVGDMVIDVETGKNAGIHTCAVTYGFESVAKLKASLPEILVNNITELKTYIT